LELKETREKLAAGFKMLGDKVNPPGDKIKVVPWGRKWVGMRSVSRYWNERLPDEEESELE